MYMNFHWCFMVNHKSNTVVKVRDEIAKYEKVTKNNPVRLWSNWVTKLHL